MSELQVTAEPGVPQVLTSRDLDAPVALVYRAFTEPELIAQWLGPRKYTMTVDRYDLRDGGTWRYVHTDEAGNAYGFHGVFHGEPVTRRHRADVRVRGRARPRPVGHGHVRGARREDHRPHQLGLPVGAGS